MTRRYFQWWLTSKLLVSIYYTETSVIAAVALNSKHRTEFAGIEALKEYLDGVTFTCRKLTALKLLLDDIIALRINPLEYEAIMLGQHIISKLKNGACHCNDQSQTEITYTDYHRYSQETDYYSDVSCFTLEHYSTYLVETCTSSYIFDGADILEERITKTLHYALDNVCVHCGLPCTAVHV